MIYRLSALSDRLAHAVILEHATTEGFVRSCNDVFAATPGRDVVLVNSDVVVGAQWLERMVDAAASSDLVATVTSLTNHVCSIVSVPTATTRCGPCLRTCPSTKPSAGSPTALTTPAANPYRVGHCLLIRASQPSST